MLIALSGKCCSGKNYVTSLLEEKGYRSVDVDIISKEVFNNSLPQIQELLGTTDRKRIGELIFSDSSLRERLEELIHPGVYKAIYSEFERVKGDKLVVNIPLLTDDEFIERTDIIIWVHSPLIIRIIRALKRDNYSIKTVISRIWSQRKLSVKHFPKSADIYYIKNGLSTTRLRRDLKKILDRLQRG